MYEVMSSHEAIISPEDFGRVQQKLAENRKKLLPFKSSWLFSGLVKCGQCGSGYCRRNNGSGKYQHFIWACNQVSEFGKETCPSQAIPEQILIAKTKEVLNLDDEATLTREIILGQITEIIVPCPFQLVYRLKDGTEKEVAWQHKSRRESWTPEMREKARQRTLAQHQRRKAKQSDNENDSNENDRQQDEVKEASI